MLRRIEMWLLDLAVAAVIALGLLITVTVVLRVTMNSGVPDTIVMVRELMVAAVLLPAAATTANRAHIVVEVISNKLPVPVQNALVVFGSVFGLIALAPLIYAGWREMTHTFASGAYFFGDLELPKWPGRVLFLLGIVVCWVRLLVLVVGDIARLRRGETLIETADGAGG